MQMSQKTVNYGGKNLGFGEGRFLQKNLGFGVSFGYRNNTTNYWRVPREQNYTCRSRDQTVVQHRSNWSSF